MNKKLLVLLFAVALIGCESMGPKTQTGAVVGGALGGVAGGVIGHQSGRGFEGAAIGAAVGAIGGGLLGNSWDKQDKLAQETNPNYITIAGIVDMAAKGMPDDVIIEEIKRTKSVYHLTSETIDYMKKNKVSNKVIDFMLSTSAQG